MKKSILIGVLAVLVLFASCTADSSLNGMVVSITATQNAEYVVGESVKASDFTFTGETNMGATVTVDPSDILIDPEYTLSAEDNTLTADDVAYVKNPSAVVVMEVKAHKVTGITVDATKAEKTYFATIKDYSYETSREVIDTDGLVVTAQYDGGSKVIDNELLDIEVWTTADTPAKATNWNTPEKYTARVSFQGFTKSYDIEIVDNYVKSVAAKKTDNYKIFYSGDTATGNLSYAADPTTTAGIYMEKTYQGGETEIVESVSTTNVVYIDPTTTNEVTTTPAGAIPSAGGTATFTLRYKGTDGMVGLSRDSVVSVEYAKNTPASLVITTPSTISKANYASTNLTGVTITVKMADGTTVSADPAVTYFNGTGTPAENYYTITEKDLTGSNYVAGNRYLFHLTGSVEGLPVNYTFTALVNN